MFLKEKILTEENLIKVRIVKLNGHQLKSGKAFLNIWEQESRLVARFCSEINCHTNHDLVGALIKKENDPSLYIVPLCNAHSMVNYEIEIPNFMRLTRYDSD